MSSFTFFLVTSHGFSYLIAQQSVIARQGVTRTSVALQLHVLRHFLKKISGSNSQRSNRASSDRPCRSRSAALAHFQIRRPFIQLVLHARQSRDNAARVRSKATSSSMDQHLVLMYLRRPRRENGNAVLMLMSGDGHSLALVLVVPELKEHGEALLRA